MSFFDNMFGHKNEPMQPENMSASPSNEPENHNNNDETDFEFHERMSEAQGRIDGKDEETDLDQVA